MSALTVAAWMTGHPFTLVADRHDIIGDMDLDRLFYQMVEGPVIVLVVLDVAIDMYAGLLDVGILVRLGRQGPQSWLSRVPGSSLKGR
jgi:hypothetical protein